MLDPGRYFAEAIYFLQYTLAQILWAVDRALLSIAVITESVNQWITSNVGYFVQLLVNGLSAPLGGMFILALTALGCWYALNHFLPSERWVDPSKLFTYGLITFFFFASPIVVIDLVEELRLSLFAGIDQALIDGAAGDIFVTDMNGTDLGLPPAIGDVNSDGVVGSFDLVAAFMAVANLDELDSNEFPVDFEATYFPFGDPAGIDLGDEADQELAKALASDGIERLFFAFFAIPTAIGEHFLRLALTGVAMLLYLGVPIAMVFAFFVSTQAFLGAYLRQFINLLIETFLSVIITAILIGLLTAAAQQGIGLFIGASVVTCFVLAWRIQSALRLAGAALDLFGGAMLTGGVGGRAIVTNGARLALGGAQAAGAVLTGGASLAVGSAVLAAATRAQAASGGAEGSSFGTAAGYVVGQSAIMRRVIEGVHEARTLTRHATQGAAQPQQPDGLDYLRAGASLSGLGSSPWLAMRLSPSLRAAYDQLGGSLMTPWPAGDGNGAPISPPASAPSQRPARPQPAAPAGTETARPAAPEEDLTEAGVGATAVIPTLFADQPSPPPPPDLDWPLSPPPALDDAALLSPVPAPYAVAAAPPSSSPEALARLERAITALTAALQGSAPIAVDWQAAPPSLLPPDPPDLARSGIRLEAADTARQAAMDAALSALAEAETPASQAAFQALVTFAGTANAGILKTTVTEHGPEPVQLAAAAVTAMAQTYRNQGVEDAGILAAFQQGDAFTDLRQTLDTPLRDDQLVAVADLALLPKSNSFSWKSAYAAMPRER